MRVWYQSLVEGGNSSYFGGLATRAQQVGRPGTEVDFVGLPPRTYGGRAPAEVVGFCCDSGAEAKRVARLAC